MTHLGRDYLSGDPSPARGKTGVDVGKVTCSFASRKIEVKNLPKRKRDKEGRVPVESRVDTVTGGKTGSGPGCWKGL